MKRFSQRPRDGHAQHGVALLECLMAMLIFSFGLLGLLGLEARVMNFSVDSEDRNRAAMLASELASQMWIDGTVTPDAPVTAATPAYNALKASVNDMANGGLPNGVVTIVPVVGTTNAADITITWTQTSDVAGQNSTLSTRVILP